MMVVKETQATRRDAYHYGLNLIVPNRWQGERDCVVGPFSSRAVAEYFVDTVTDFGHYDAYSKRVFAKGDGWFVEVLNDVSLQRVVITS